MCVKAVGAAAASNVGWPVIRRISAGLPSPLPLPSHPQPPRETARHTDNCSHRAAQHLPFCSIPASADPSWVEAARSLGAKSSSAAVSGPRRGWRAVGGEDVGEQWEERRSASSETRGRRPEDTTWVLVPQVSSTQINTPRKQGGLGPTKIPLVSDLRHSICTDYGILKEDEGIAFRGLFIIDNAGILRQIMINDLPVGRSVDEVMRLVQAFQFTDEHGEVCPANWKPGAETITPDVEKSKNYFAKQK
uniref:uncharacterized protein isoform X1 n=1 Tax=Pristiophorus japonicus TaxID=55135 RepID=UPI00398F6379